MAHKKLHKDEHTDGTDDIQDATASVKGLATATQITKLGTIAESADVTGDNAPQAHAIGGSGHSADTLANLNTKVSDATLGDVSALETTMDGKITTHAGLADPHTGYQLESEKSASNGYASLDSGGKVPTSELPSSITGGVSYQGTWNANTNVPTLTSSTGTQGHYYVVSTAGSTNLDGITDWKIGDWAIYNGTTWEKVDNSEPVSSVFSRTGIVIATQDDYTHAQLNTIGVDDHHNEIHSSTHEDGGGDEIEVEAFATASSLAHAILQPDGIGGLGMVDHFHSSASAPTPATFGEWHIWEDTGNGKLYLVAYGNSLVKMVELA